MKPRRSGARKLSRTATRTRRERGARESPRVAGCADPRLVTGREAARNAAEIFSVIADRGVGMLLLVEFGKQPGTPRSDRYDGLHPAAHDFPLTSVSGSRQTYIQVYTSGDGTRSGDRVPF